MKRRGQSHSVNRWRLLDLSPNMGAFATALTAPKPSGDGAYTQCSHAPGGRWSSAWSALSLVVLLSVTAVLTVTGWAESCSFSLRSLCVCRPFSNHLRSTAVCRAWGQQRWAEACALWAHLSLRLRVFTGKWGGGAEEGWVFCPPQCVVIMVFEDMSRALGLVQLHLLLETVTLQGEGSGRGEGPGQAGLATCPHHQLRDCSRDRSLGSSPGWARLGRQGNIPFPC